MADPYFVLLKKPYNVYYLILRSLLKLKVFHPDDELIRRCIDLLFLVEIKLSKQMCVDILECFNFLFNKNVTIDLFTFCYDCGIFTFIDPNYNGKHRLCTDCIYNKKLHTPAFLRNHQTVLQKHDFVKSFFYEIFLDYIRSMYELNAYYFKYIHMYVRTNIYINVETRERRLIVKECEYHFKRLTNNCTSCLSEGVTSYCASCLSRGIVNYHSINKKSKLCIFCEINDVVNFVLAIRRGQPPKHTSATIGMRACIECNRDVCTAPKNKCRNCEYLEFKNGIICECGVRICNYDDDYCINCICKQRNDFIEAVKNGREPTHTKATRFLQYVLAAELIRLVVCDQLVVVVN